MKIVWLESPAGLRKITKHHPVTVNWNKYQSQETLDQVNINIHPNFPQLLKMVRFTYFESFLSFLIPNQLWIKHQNTKFQVISTPYKFWCKWIQNSTITIQIFLKNFNWHKLLKVAKKWWLIIFTNFAMDLKFMQMSNSNLVLYI